ncbi:MAG: hypothetical protein OQJ77_04155 [Thiovulaceae bacterium]|nr:hypothetical protein [Sulfurimonadaceae bacterium]MCW9026489.1 hypothetical protein [Sulfurimonadaceae bacterium]
MKLLLIFHILFLSNYVFAKGSDYSIVIDKPFNNKLLDIGQDYDRCISAVGFVKKYNTKTNHSNTYTDAFDYLESISNAYGTQMQLIKVDAGANILIDKSSALSSFSEAVSLVKTPTNGYYIGGHTMNGQIILVKLDSAANIIFKKVFGTKNFDRLKNIVKLNDGGVLAIGTSSTSRNFSDPLFNSGLGLNDIYVTRFSKDGYEIWSKKYGTEFDDNGIDAVEAQDGSIIIVGQTMHGQNKNLMLMRINENGNKIWSKTYTDRTVMPKKIIKLKDNNFLLSLSYNDELNKEQIRLIKFDLRNNIIYDKTIHTLYESALLDIKEFSDGGIVGVGYVKDTFNTDGLAMMFDSKLNMLYQEHYGEDNYDMLNSLVILNNSQVAAAGIHTDVNSQESNMWILKLNRDASVAQIASSTNEFYEKLIQLFSNEIKTNKIKIKKDLTIELLDNRLLFKVAKYELNKTQKIFLEKFSDKLIPFLHKNQDIVDTLEINGHTSSEWGNVGFSQNFLNNEKLSMNRAYSTMSFIFKSQNKKLQNYLGNIFKGSGYGFSKRIILDNAEYKEKSRRVSFKIILNENK